MPSRRSSAFTRHLIAAALCLVPFPAVAWCQCFDWVRGPLEDNLDAVGADGVVWDMTSWDPDGAGPRRAMLVIAGEFTTIQGVAVNHIAARDPVTGRWEALGTGFEDGVYALGVYKGELIAGGNFVTAGGQPAQRIARWNGGRWRPLGGGVGTAIAHFVEGMTVHGGELIVCGLFNSAGGAPCANIGAWNGTSWRALGTGVNSQTRCAITFAGALYVGGTFTQAGGVATTGIARWNGTTWQSVGGVAGSSIAEVRSLGIFNGELVTGGQFTHAGGVPASNIARWNGSAWQSLGFGVDGTVDDLAVHDGVLVAGGVFSSAGDLGVVNVAKWDGSEWERMGAGLDTRVNALVVNEQVLFAGGHFFARGVEVLNYVVRWGGSEWHPFGGGSVNDIRAFAPFRSSLVAAGDFDQSTHSTPAHEIVRWDGVALQPFGTGMNGPVLALSSFQYPGSGGDHELIAGGSFTLAGGVVASNIARWVEDPLNALPPPAWQPMGGGFNAEVFEVERIGGDAYAVGNFTSPTSRVARWNETTDTWEPMGGVINGPVRAIEFYSGSIYIGGAFTTAGGITTGGLARWNGASWQSVGFTTVGSVHALEEHAGELAIVGEFNLVAGSPSIARWNGSVYSAYGVGGVGGGTARALYSHGGRLYLGGDFSSVGGVSADFLAMWNGSAWSRVASGGLDARVRAIHAFQGEVHVGGQFKIACPSEMSTPGWGRYLASGAPWIAGDPLSQSVGDGGNASFHAAPSSGYTAATFRWYQDGVPIFDTGAQPGVLAGAIRGAATPSLFLEGVGSSDAGAYSVIMSLPGGADTSAVATLEVNGTVDAAPIAAPRLSRFESIGPNPTRGAVRFGIALARDARVRVHVHDVAGRRARVVDLGARGAGRHAASWDGADETGHLVGAGLYFVSLELDGIRVGARRLTVMR